MFKGETRSGRIWTSDFLEGNADIAFLPDGRLIVAVEHQGLLAVGNDNVSSSEVGMGAVSVNGQIIDRTNESGVIFWLVAPITFSEENPRVVVTPTGESFFVFNGPTFDSEFNAVLIHARKPGYDG